MKHKRSTKTKIYCIFAVAVASFSLLITCFTCANAYASLNGQDKLYGETFTQRDMPVKNCPNIGAEKACLTDIDGNIIYERDGYAEGKIASMTKIMTAIIALENSSMTEILEITEKAVKIGESSAGFWVGDKIDMESAIYALLVPSGNDAAEAICCHIGNKLIQNKDDRIRNKSQEQVQQEAEDNNINQDDVSDVYINDPEAAFCKLMNLKAQDLGCTNTNFTNPHGLDAEEYANPNQKSCAIDVAKFTRYAMKNQLFRKIVAGGDKIINVTRNGVVTPLRLNSTDELIVSFEGCIGVKTGVTDDAGACFSGACRDDSGVEIYTVVMKCDNEATRFIDTQNLFNWYYTNKIDFKLNDTDDKQTMNIDGQVKEVGVVAYLAHNQWVDCTFPTTIEDQSQVVPILKIAGNIHYEIEPENISGNIKAGDKVAQMVLTQHNCEVGRVNLIAVKDQPAPNIFQMIGVAWDRLWKSVAQQPTVAKHKLVFPDSKFNIDNK